MSPSRAEEEERASEVVRRSSASDVHPRAKTRLHILVIDDEPLIGMVVKDAFDDEIVETFVDPAAALKRAFELHFDVIFCDLMMPRMTGIDVYNALAAMMPDLAQRFVLMTGSANSDAIADFLKAHPVVFLPKPFRLADLQRCISAVSARAG